MLRQAPEQFARAIVDAEALPFRSGSFTAVVMAFMVQHLVDPPRAFAEVRRVMRPGGRLGIAMWGTVREPSAMATWGGELDLAGAPDAPPIVQQQVDVNSPSGMQALLDGAGFRAIEIQPIHWDDEPDLNTFIARHLVIGAASRRFDGLAPAAQHAFVERIRDRLAALPHGALRDESEVFGVVAVA
jgi:SAM-dependent methyltransferase